jgi:CrcB protein
LKGRRALPLVATGGALGATTRYGADTAFPSPASTLVVNAVGCFALGYVLYASRFGAVSERGRAFVAAGFLSSFTTYSTFALEAFTSRPGVAVTYVAASYALGFVAVATGSAFATRLTKGRVSDGS